MDGSAANLLNGISAIPSGNNVCGVLVSAIEPGSARELVLDRARARAPLALSALAVHGVMTGMLSREQRGRLNRLDVAVPDGQPVRWALNLLYRTGLRERVSGPDLMLALCEQAAREGLGVYLYGTDASSLRALQVALGKRFPELEIAGSSPSRFGYIDDRQQAEIAKEIRASGASLCFVGIGCPRQETFCVAMRDAIGIPLIAVGAAFDFHSGESKRAPAWMQRAGLEWLYRLMSEPRRLWRRYILLNPMFVVALLAQWLHLYQPSARQTDSCSSSSDTLRVPG